MRLIIKNEGFHARLLEKPSLSQKTCSRCIPPGQRALLHTSIPKIGTDVGGMDRVGGQADQVHLSDDPHEIAKLYL